METQLSQLLNPHHEQNKKDMKTSERKKQGELRERDLQDQLQRASALNILINAISIWNTVYLEKAVEYQKKHKGIDENLLKHISPLNW